MVGSGSARRDGWHHTGDLGFRSEGEFFITGRRKDVIKRGGISLHPIELESVVEHTCLTYAPAGKSHSRSSSKVTKPSESSSSWSPPAQMKQRCARRSKRDRLDVGITIDGSSWWRLRTVPRTRVASVCGKKRDACTKLGSSMGWRNDIGPSRRADRSNGRRASGRGTAPRVVGGQRSFSGCSFDEVGNGFHRLSRVCFLRWRPARVSAGFASSWARSRQCENSPMRSWRLVGRRESRMRERRSGRLNLGLHSMSCPTAKYPKH